ncbi:MAG: hypothetical protein R3F20_05510 [Planctomycetota bacterium]
MASESDIPVVESEIRPVSGMLAGHYDPLATAAVEEFVDRLDQRDLDESNAEEIAALVVILLLRRKISTTPGDPRRARARASARRLILARADDAGGSSRLRRHGPTVEKAAARLADGVFADSKWRIEHGGTESAAKRALIGARTAARDLRDAEEVAHPKPGPRPSSPSPGDARRRGRRAPTGPLPDEVRRELIRDLTKAAWVGRRSITDALADAWAYRAYNVNRFLALQDQGVHELVAFNNPPRGPDWSTTTFCVRIHGQVVKTERIRKGLGGHFAAVRENDPVRAFRALPLGTLGKVKMAADFRALRGLAGLSPYHYGLRTILADARFSRLGKTDGPRMSTST